MQAGEECGFHGNPRKAELWVSVPALHCTGPRLSAALLSLSSLPHYSFLFTPPFSPLQSLPSPAPPHLPPSCERGSLTHTHTHTYAASSILSIPESTCAVTVLLCRHYHTSTMNPCARSHSLHHLIFYLVQVH